MTRKDTGWALRTFGMVGRSDRSLCDQAFLVLQCIGVLCAATKMEATAVWDGWNEASGTWYRQGDTQGLRLVPMSTDSMYRYVSMTQHTTQRAASLPLRNLPVSRLTMFHKATQQLCSGCEPQVQPDRSDADKTRLL